MVNQMFASLNVNFQQWYIVLRHLVNIAIMTVTCELPSYPVPGTGIFASVFNGLL